MLPVAGFFLVRFPNPLAFGSNLKISRQNTKRTSFRALHIFHVAMIVIMHVICITLTAYIWVFNHSPAQVSVRVKCEIALYRNTN